MKIKPNNIFHRAVRLLNIAKASYLVVEKEFLGDSVSHSVLYVGNKEPAGWLGFTGDRFLQINGSKWVRFPKSGWVKVFTFEK